MNRTRYHMNLPDFMASLHDLDPSLVEIIDKQTRETIKEDRAIIFADAKHGYYVVADLIPLENGQGWVHGNFKAVCCNHFVIRRYIDKSRIEYYDSDEMYG